MSANQNPETSANQLAETISVPFLSFLIIEPDPVIKNAIPTHIEKLTKERKFADAIKAIDAALAKSPRNVQLRFLKARLCLGQEHLGWDHPTVSGATRTL